MNIPIIAIIMATVFANLLYGAEVVMAPYENRDSEIINEGTAVLFPDSEIKSIGIVDNGDDRLMVSIEFRGSGITKNALFSKSQLGNRIAISINGTLVSKPIVIMPSDKAVNISTALTRAQLVKMLETKRAQQVDSAEASTIGSGESGPSGSPR